MAATQTARWSSPSTDVNLTIGFVTHEPIHRDIGPGESLNRALESNDRLPGLQQRLQELQGPLTGNTPEMNALEALPLVRYLAEMSLELSSHSAQIQQLKSALEPSQHTPYEDSVHSELATTIDVFFDCASSLPDDESDTRLERIEKAFFGSPNPYFETSSDFYPEQYTLDDRLNDRLTVQAMIQSQEDEHTRKLLITYAQSRREWRRVVVSAAFRTGPTHPEFQCTLRGGHEFWPGILPKPMSIILNDLLSGLDLFASITHVSLPLMIEDEPGELTVDVDGVRAVEDHQEVALCNDDQILQDIEDMNCAVFLESEVVVKWQISVSRFEVLVRSQTCTERKAPFPSASGPGRDSFQEFCDDIRMLARLRGCQGVVQFVGVVLDDSRKYLRSYLHESVSHDLEGILDSALSLSLEVPWSVRETWARELITAIGEVHGKGAVFGLICLGYIDIRADGSIALATSERSWAATLLPGCRAPEWRKPGKEAVPSIEVGLPLSTITSTSGASMSCAIGTKKMDDCIDTTTSAGASPSPRFINGGDKGLPQSPNFRTEIFVLGMLLWLLAEHRATRIGYLCARNGCTNRPRYACEAPHTDPIELPDCRKEIPAYFQEMIRKCRSLDPKDRPSARQLLAMFPDEVRNGTAPPEMHNVMKLFPPLASGPSVYCDECCSLTTDDHYHCNICNNDDLDLCPPCVAQGIHCFGQEHKLIRWVRRTDI